MVLFGLFFQPVGIAVKDTLAALREAKKVSPAVRKLGEGAIPFDGGFYPVILQNYVCAECIYIHHLTVYIPYSFSGIGSEMTFPAFGRCKGGC